MNFNVYKVFKNGKRAKSPIHVFSFNGTVEEANNYFRSHEIENLEEKFKKKIGDLNYRIIDAENAQNNNLKSSDDVFRDNKNKVLGKLVKTTNIKSKRNLVGGLVYCKKSDWRWQWAALEAATNNYIEGLSPHFDSYEGAHDWMKTQIAALSTGK